MQLPVVVRHLRRYAAAYGVLFLSLLPTLVVFLRLKSDLQREDFTRFQQNANSATIIIERQLRFYINQLRAIEGFFAVTERVTPADLGRFLRKMGIQNQENHAGLLDLGIVWKIPSKLQEMVIAELPLQGFKDYSTKAVGTEQSAYPIVFLDDFQRVAPIVPGYDPSTDPSRREAMERACDTAEPAITMRLELYSSTTNLQPPGFIIYLPIYKNGTSPETVEERRKSLQGYVFGAFLPAELFKDVIPKGELSFLDLAIYDGIGVDLKRVIYDSRFGDPPGKGTRSPGFRSLHEASLLGKTWTLDFMRRNQAGWSARDALPYFFLIVGMSISMALFGIVMAQINSREQAHLLAVEVRAAHQFTQQIINNAGQGIFVCDAAGDCILWNHYMEDLTGKLAAEAEGRKITDLLPSLKTREIEQQMTQALEGRITTSADLQVTVPGKPVPAWVIITCGPHRNADGDVAGIVGLVNEISARKEAESALKASQERFRNVIESLGEGVLLTQLDDTILYANSRAAEILGYPAEEIVGRPTYKLLRSADYQSMAVERGQRWINTGTERHEFMAVRKNGDLYWVMISGAPLRDAKGAVVGAVAVMADITSQKRDQEALRASEERMRTIYEVAPIGVITLRVGGEFLAANPATCTIWGYNEAELLEMKFEDLVHPDEREENRRLFDRLVSGHISSFRAERRCLGKSGRVVWTDTAVAVVNDRYGTAHRFVGMVADVGMRKEAEAERQLIERKLQETQKLESLGVLAGGVAHDFNNLLTAILGNASLARLEQPLSLSTEHFLAQIEDASRRAADLCRQMLAYSGKGRFVVQRLDLNTVVEDTAQLLKVSIDKKAVLRFCLDENLPAVEADPVQLRQIVMNLVINASEALGDAGGSIHLSTGRIWADRAWLGNSLLGADLPAGDYVLLEVSDTGCGMSPETMTRIFDPFYTTKFAGRGLGLAAVLGIVRGHRGALKVESELGRGTTFKLLLPSADGGAEPLALESPLNEDWRGTGTILVADDEAAIRGLTTKILTNTGFTVIQAEDGREAVEKFARDPGAFTLVLLDFTMPNLDGPRTFAELRRLRPDIPVLVMSGFSEQEVSGRFSGAGVNGFIQKPFSSQELRARLHAIMGC